MTDTPPNETKKSIPKGTGNIWTDIGPVLAFVIVFNVLQNGPEGPALFGKDNAIFWATGVFMAAVAAAIGWTLMKGRKLPPMLIITGTVVMVFGGLTLFLQDKTFAFIKPTIINLLFAGTIFGSLAIGRPADLAIVRPTTFPKDPYESAIDLSTAVVATLRSGRVIAGELPGASVLSQISAKGDLLPHMRR